MSEQVHPYCRCLSYVANALARNISRLGEDAFAVGIRGMRERIRQFEGEMEIKSTASGTTVRVAVPIPDDSGSVDNIARLN